MVRALFDTNILIDYLNAEPQAREEIQRYADKAIGIVTRMKARSVPIPVNDPGIRSPYGL